MNKSFARLRFAAAIDVFVWIVAICLGTVALVVGLRYYPADVFGLYFFVVVSWAIYQLWSIRYETLKRQNKS
jgi:hypothetical protein